MNSLGTTAHGRMSAGKLLEMARTLPTQDYLLGGNLIWQRNPVIYIYIDDSPIRELQNRTLFHPVPMEQIRRLRHPPSSDKPKLIQMTYDLEYVCWTVPNLFFKQRTQTPAPAPGRPRSFSSIHQEAAAPASQSWICPPEPRRCYRWMLIDGAGLGHNYGYSYLEKNLTSKSLEIINTTINYG